MSNTSKTRGSQATRLALPLLACLAGLSTATAGLSQAESDGQTGRAHPFEAKQLSADEVRQELGLLKRALEHIHPGLTRYTSRKKLEESFAALRARCADGATELELYRRISIFCSQIRCGHTRVMAPRIDAYRIEHATQLPFTFRIFDGKVFVDAIASAAQDKLRRGDRIDAIEGTSCDTLLREIGDTVCLDGFTDAARASRLDTAYEFADSGFDHYLPAWIGFRSSFRLRVSRDGEAFEVDVPAIDRAAWKKLTPSVRDFCDSTSIEELDADSALLTIGTFVNFHKPVSPIEHYRELFRRLNSKGYKKLIVDLRSNGGGSTDASQALLRFLLPEVVHPAKPPILKNYRCPEDLRKHLTTWVDKPWSRPASMFRKIERDGVCIGYEVPMMGVMQRKTKGHPDRFRGRITVLTSRYNASGSTMLLARLQSAGIRLVGEETAGSALGPTAGTLFTLKLPTSRIQINIPVFLQRTGLEGFEEGKGVTPKVVVRPTKDDFLARRDPVLAAARKL